MFEVFGTTDMSEEIRAECYSMFAALTTDNYAKSTIRPETVRKYAKEYGIKVSVISDMRSFGSIVRLKPIEKGTIVDDSSIS